MLSILVACSYDYRRTADRIVDGEGHCGYEELSDGSWAGVLLLLLFPHYSVDHPAILFMQQLGLSASCFQT
jgi:hypothetical protein